jgi:hypothetical protein
MNTEIISKTICCYDDEQATFPVKPHPPGLHTRGCRVRYVMKNDYREYPLEIPLHYSPEEKDASLLSTIVELDEQLQTVVNANYDTPHWSTEPVEAMAETFPIAKEAKGLYFEKGPDREIIEYQAAIDFVEIQPVPVENEADDPNLNGGR